MAKVKSKSHYHGSDGYRFPGQEWEVSDEEAAGLVEAGSVELVEEKAEKASDVAPKEDKQSVVTKEEKAPVVTKEEKPAVITTANVVPAPVPTKEPEKTAPADRPEPPK